MLKKIIFVMFLFNVMLFSQISVQIDSINFNDVLTNQTDSVSFYVVNDNNSSVTLKLSTFKSVFILSDTSLIISSGDSVLVWLKYKPNQNVIDKDLLEIKSADSTFGKIIEIKGSGKFGDSYDASTFNLYDNQLKGALTQLVINHYSLGYNLARDKMFMEIDNQKVNGQNASENTLECVYTGRLAVGYSNRTEAQNSPYNFNTEHTWPQSNFSEAEPMKSDLYHLFPTDITANAQRANYPFGNVVSNITWQVGGSKLGLNNSGQIVFEPRDIHKGNVSRSMFYFITRYPANYGGFFTKTQEDVFREWNKLDPVDAAESNRNDAIASLQLKRNPYIDHPEFVDRIYSFATSNVRPVSAKLDLLPLKINFDSVAVSDSGLQKIYLANSGNTPLVIDSVIVDNQVFTFTVDNLIVQPFSTEKLSVQFNPDMIKEYSAKLTVYSDGGVQQLELKGIGVDRVVAVKETNNKLVVYFLNQNYPNPFNPGTVISYQLAVSSQVVLKVYDVLGNEITTLVDEYKPAGKYEVEFNAATLPSGIYFYQIKSGKFIQTRKMLLMK